MLLTEVLRRRIRVVDRNWRERSKDFDKSMNEAGLTFTEAKPSGQFPQNPVDVQSEENGDGSVAEMRASDVIPARRFSSMALHDCRIITESCINTYTSSVTGIGPEVFVFKGEGNKTNGITIKDEAFYDEHGFDYSVASYVLRPEVLESVFCEQDGPLFSPPQLID